MKNNEYTSLVNKYAILLFIGLGLSELIKLYLNHFYPGMTGEPVQSMYLSNLHLVIMLITNIIAAVWVSKDLKKFKVTSNLIVVMTVFFSLLGVTMFFIITNRSLRNQAHQEIEGKN